MKNLMHLLILLYSLNSWGFLLPEPAPRYDYPKACNHAEIVLINQPEILPWKTTYSFSLEEHPVLNIKSRHVKNPAKKESKLKAFVYDTNFDSYLVGQDIVLPKMMICLHVENRNQSVKWVIPVMKKPFKQEEVLDEFTITTPTPYLVVGTIYEPNDREEATHLDHSFIVQAITLLKGKPYAFSEALIEFDNFASRSNDLLKKIRIID